MAATKVALLSGVLGATASCLAKLAFGSSTLQVQARCEQLLRSNSSSSAGWWCCCCYWTELLLVRGLGVVGMIACNAGQLGTFLEGMEAAGSVAGTALSTAANFAVSACYGHVLWGERFSATWWAGFAMVMAGVMVLSSTNATTTTTTTARHGDERPKKD